MLELPQRGWVCVKLNIRCLSYCGVVLDVEDGLIIRLSGDRDHPANRWRLCTISAAAADTGAKMPDISSRPDDDQFDQRGLSLP
ncbi:hypothetical protein [Martelella mediterranea]|uniref:hypothetical protein n=1 Tax=Martelella mediterranea TaxID=293089 RepID=UPI001404D0CA|nr:hypothetical protein [Martelella mediterranea]